MKKILDKLFSKIKLNKKVIVFLIIVAIVALITGSILVVLLDKTDKGIVSTYLTNYIDKLSQNKLEYFSILKNSLWSNIGVTIGIWLLGISVIGIPITLFLYFSQIFTFGFALASMLFTYKLKGIILSLIYIFPHYLIFLGMLMILTSYSITLSIKLIITIFKRQQIDFKPISNRYLLILMLSFIIAILFSLYETYALPNIIKLIVPILT